MENERVVSNDRSRIIVHIAGITLLIAVLAAYRCTDVEVDPDEAYPKPACFDALDPVNQDYFLRNRAFILEHPDAHSPSTEEVLLHVECPDVKTGITLSPDNPALSSTAP